MSAIATIVIMSVLSLSAQDSERKKAKKSAEERTEIIMNKFTEKLDLSDEQQSQIKPLVMEREQKRNEGMMEKDTRMKYHNAIGEFLTAEQKEIFNGMKSGHHKNKDHEGPHHGHDKMKHSSDDQ